MILFCWLKVQTIPSCVLFFPDQNLTNNSWKIHEEFGLLIDDITQNIRNEQHPRYVYKKYLHREQPNL